MQRWADLLCELVEESRVIDSELRPLSPTIAFMIIGGVHELILRTLDTDVGDSPHPFTDLVEPISELITAVFSPPRMVP